MIYRDVDSVPEQLKVAWAAHTVVTTNGFFEILHCGHLRMLKVARGLAPLPGDVVIVLLNHDQETTRQKGEGRPINKWQYRAEMLQGLSCVDHVIGFHQPTACYAIASLEPRFHVKGNCPIDDIPEWEQIADVGADLVVFWNHERFSTTELIFRAAVSMGFNPQEETANDDAAGDSQAATEETADT